MQSATEIQFQISLLNMVSQGESQRHAEELEQLLQQQVPVEKR